MPKVKNSHAGFTLIEVMVAVMIVSVVIAALLTMQGDASNKFSEIKKMVGKAQYNSFLLSNSGKYGFEKSRTDMNTLLEEFELESDLRRKLKSINVNIEYEELNIMDTSEIQESEEEVISTASVIFEIGKTKVKTEEFSSDLVRVRIQ